MSSANDSEAYKRQTCDKEMAASEAACAKLECDDVLGSGRPLKWSLDSLFQGVPEAQAYKSVGGSDLRLLIVKPEGWKPEDRRPAILWIHGGGWMDGQPEQFLPHCRYAALRGAVGISVQYRLIPKDEARDSALPQSSGGRRHTYTAASKPTSQASGVEDCLSDCIDALRFIKERAQELGIDPERIAVAGDSAGGHLAACIGTLPPDHPLGVFALINCNGIVDLTDKWRHSSLARQQKEALSDEQAVTVWFERRETARGLSPLQRIRPGQPPSLTLHGLLDRTVEAEQSVRYVEAHLGSGNDARLILYPCSKHAFILFGYTAAAAETMEALGDIDAYLEDIGFWREEH